MSVTQDTLFGISRHERRRDLRPPLLAESYLVVITVGLVAFSILMLYSTTSLVSQQRFGDPLYYVKRQSAAALVGLVAMWLASRTPIEWIRKASPTFFPIALLLLALPLLPGIGDTAGGAQRWVQLGPVRFQPGEFVKILFVVFMAGYFARHEERLKQFVPGVVVPLFMTGSLGALLLLQPDFGSTVVIVTVTLLMGAVSGIRPRYLIGAGVLLALVLALLVVVSPYRMARVLTFLTPWNDASGKGYQLIQSLIAVGTGQLTGVGLGESQQKLFFLPAAHTDFLFSVISEELGFLGAVTIVGLFLLFLWRGFRLADRFVDNSFSFALCVGLTLLVVLPALLNVGVVTGLLPTKGMVLPLLGYGGSSLIATLIAVGLLLALARSLTRS